MSWRPLLVLAGVLLVLAGCTPAPPAPPPDYNRPERSHQPVFAGAPVLPPPNLADEGPGSLVEVTPIDDMASFALADATIVRVKYRSTSGDGKPTTVSGIVAVPPGKAPKGGWPIVSYGHPMSGVMNWCAPSTAKELGGIAPFLVTLISRGYMVAMTDYQGLGIGGTNHSILDTAAMGNNMIDVVRAARRVLPDASGDRWAALGTGEGGTAAWAAAERSAGYGGGLDMVGAVALSPFADLTPLADAAADGKLTADQNRLLIMTLQSLANKDPEFDLDAYRSVQAADEWGAIVDCAPDNPGLAQKNARELKPDDLRPRSPEAAGALRAATGAAALPQVPGRTEVPVLVIYATADKTVPAAGTKQALSRACGKGDRVEIMERIGDFDTNNQVAIESAMLWIAARFDGVSMANICLGPT